MKILINRKPIEGPWGGGNNFVKSFCSHAAQNGHAVIFGFEDDIDVILMQDPRYNELRISVNEIAQYKLEHPSTKIIHRINECDARKNTTDMDPLLKACSKISDISVFVSEWIKDYHLSRGWLCNKTAVCYNGVDQLLFKPNAKLNNGKINIVTHHWSSNFMKGFDVYEALDIFVGMNPDFTFTYIGRENGTFKHTRIIPPTFGKELAAELGKYDIYISGSRFDPGPNHILESLACRLPTYVHHDGGGAVELAGIDHSYKSISELTELLLQKKFVPNNSYTLIGWKKCMENYLRLMS
jgi:glycosyltransferase involved in cell wall biosynthesis